MVITEFCRSFSVNRHEKVMKIAGDIGLPTRTGGRRREPHKPWRAHLLKGNERKEPLSVCRFWCESFMTFSLFVSKTLLGAG